MDATEQRIAQLDAVSYTDDMMLESDIPLVRKGVLLLNWCDRAEGRAHPFVTASPRAVSLIQTHGRLTPADRRNISESSKVLRSDIDWARKYIETKH